MKKKTSHKHLWLKKACCLILAFAMIFSSMSIAPKAAATATTEAELVAKTNPFLQSYKVSDANGLWAVTASTRFVVEATGENITNERLAEVVKLINSEFVKKEIASSTPHTMVYGPAGSQGAADIMIRLVDVKDITSETTSEEAYKITISNLGVVIEAASENAVMYALRTIQTMMLTNNGLVFGTIVDYPELAERRLHVDCGRKYFSKEWFIRQIREMSYLKMNTLQMHFAENLGFRIECDTDPQIVSEQHLKKDEVREILAEAKKYGIKVIPSLDTPGHVEHILKFHPEYGQIANDGTTKSTVALDVTNPEAVAYVYSLYNEYMELFEGCTDFHIGGDEYMEFDRTPFTDTYQSVLTDYAVKKWGSGYTWKDTIANYINELAAHVYSKGFKPRIFNDGIYYGESSYYQTPQKIKMHDYIGIDFWSQMSWNPSIARLQTFIDKGHTDIYNFNASYFYYVLRNDKPTDGREQHSFDVLNQDANIYNNWTPGKFQENTIADDHESIAGAAMSIWCDRPDLCSEDVVHTDIASALRSLAAKSWNTASNSILSYDNFVALTEVIGNAAGYEKGAKLPEVGEFSALENLGKVVIKYQDTKGNAIKADDTMYGESGTDYSFTAPAIYLWIAEDTDAVTGTYSETDKEIIFVYAIDSNPVMYDSDAVTYPSVMEYKTTGKEFSLTDGARFVIISNNFTLLNKTLENDLKLLSSEFNELGLTSTSMNIVYGTEDTPKAGDIVIRMEEPSDNISPEAYEIKINDYAEVTATGEAGIFYGIRTIQKAMKLNDGKMDCGKITDAPSVEVRSFHLDNARKYFSKDWVIALIKDLSYQNYNTLQYHFSENEGYRLESSTLESIEGWSYPSDGYITKTEMLEIIETCNKYHIELVPSLDSPGHMTYVLDHLPDDWNCTRLWPADWRSEQTFNIFEKQECKDFLVSLFTEYAKFFSDAGCKHMNIGGDEFLNQFSRMTNEQYVLVMNYFNDIAALVKSYGLTPRAWNDGLLFGDYTGYKLDSDIEICYWSGPENCASIAKFVENGHKIINFSDVYMYFAVNSWWMNNANASGQKILSEFTPGKLAGSATYGEQSVEYPYPDYLLGASYALWVDDPGYMTVETITNHIYLRTRAAGEKIWNPHSTLTNSQFESIANTLGHAPGYDGSKLPAPGEVFPPGTLGTIVLRYVDKDGNSLKNDRTVYGLVDAEYTITPDKISGYRFVSMDKAAEGTFTEEEVAITLTYELYTDKEELQAAVDSALLEKNCIPATYATYGKALKNAKDTLVDETASQEAVDKALKALTDARDGVIALDRVDLYLQVTYPVGSAGFTTSSYNEYKSAITAAATILHDADATATEVEEALREILMKKAALTAVPDSDLITVTSTDPTYFAGNYVHANMLDNNLSSFTWLSNEQHVGDELKFEFAKPIVLNSFRYQAPADAQDDIFKDAVVEVSSDEQTWETIGTLKNEVDKTINAGGKTIQYLRVRIVGSAEFWVKIAEVSFNYETNDVVDKSALNTAINSAKALNKANYTSASWKVFETALENAETTNKKEDATVSEVNAVIAALEGSVNALVESSLDNNITRLYGQNRFTTSFAVAEEYKKLFDVEKFKTVIIATGTGYADALSGSYLAIRKNAPILLSNPDDVDSVVDYVKANLIKDGKIYILGGTGAVPADVETKLADHTKDISRLKDADRFGTNIKILEEAEIEGATEILVATGASYADSLSASATNKPIMLVAKALTATQKTMLEKLSDNATIYILGGTAAVSEKVEAELKAYGTVDRIKGADRFETSVAIAEKFFEKDIETVTFAYGRNYPDGLCGGPVAAAVHAPIILVDKESTDAAAAYATGVEAGYIFGGTSAVPNIIVNEILGEDIQISNIKYEELFLK